MHEITFLNLFFGIALVTFGVLFSSYSLSEAKNPNCYNQEAGANRSLAIMGNFESSCFFATPQWNVEDEHPNAMEGVKRLIKSNKISNQFSGPLIINNHCGRKMFLWCSIDKICERVEWKNLRRFKTFHFMLFLTVCW